MTADDFRELALSLEDATEKSHMGHPDFRANGRIFSPLGPGEKWGRVKLTPEELQRIEKDSRAIQALIDELLADRPTLHKRRIVPSKWPP